jgi:hypothetical protein
VPQVILAKDDKMVEALGLYSAHPNFRVGIYIWRTWWNGPEINAIGFQD